MLKIFRLCILFCVILGLSGVGVYSGWRYHAGLAHERQACFVITEKMVGFGRVLNLLRGVVVQMTEEGREHQRIVGALDTFEEEHALTRWLELLGGEIDFKHFLSSYQKFHNGITEFLQEVSPGQHHTAAFISSAQDFLDEVDQMLLQIELKQEKLFYQNAYQVAQLKWFYQDLVMIVVLIGVGIGVYCFGYLNRNRFVGLAWASAGTRLSVPVIRPEPVVPATAQQVDITQVQLACQRFSYHHALFLKQISGYEAQTHVLHQLNYELAALQNDTLKTLSMLLHDVDGKLVFVYQLLESAVDLSQRIEKKIKEQDKEMAFLNSQCDKMGEHIQAILLYVRLLSTENQLLV